MGLVTVCGSLNRGWGIPKGTALGLSVLLSCSIGVFASTSTTSPSFSTVKEACVSNLWLGLDCYTSAALAYSYPIDWGRVTTSSPTWFSGGKELGDCVCDMTSSMCDQNCECDSDCSTSEKALFTGSLEQGPVDVSYPTCVDPDYIKVNERGELVTSVVDGLLCIDRSNDPSEGTYYDTISTPPTSALDSIVSSTAYTYQKNLVQTPTPTPSVYSFGEKIVAATGNSTYLTSTATGYLPVPARNHMSECSRLSRFAQYRRFVDTEEGECVLYTSNLASDCASVFSAQNYGNNLWVGKNPTSIPTDATGYVSVSLSSVWLLDTSTGKYSLIGNTEVPAPYYTSTSCTCDRALKTVIYTLNHTETGSIVSASADIVVTSVSADSSSCTTARSTATFMVRYYTASDFTESPTLSPNTISPTTPTTSSPTSGPSTLSSAPTVSPTESPTYTVSPSVTPVSRNLEPLPKSGNPGYRKGFPVLAGSLALENSTSTRTAINRFLEGLVLLGHTSTGACTVPTSTTRLRQGIRFGVASMVGCKLSLTLADLESACASGIETYFNTSVTYIGQWGNSTLLNAKEWKKVDFDTFTTSAGAWGGYQTRTCTGMLNSAHWQFFTKRTGSVYNPQEMIVAARVKYQSTTWTFGGTDSTVAEDFLVFATADFYSIADDPSVDTPKPPPLFPKFPHDVLYPLYTDGD
ncbi:hypothetical protein AAMO2058_001278100 [Amorphochlora amoebiformis]